MSLFVSLDLSSWEGLSIGARHHYAVLKSEDNKYVSIKLEAPISASEAKRRNKDAGFAAYKVGFISERFSSKQEAVRFAVSCYKTHFPDAQFLLVGSATRLNPSEVVDGPEPWKTRLNKIYQKYEELYEKLGDYDPRYLAVSDVWEELVKELQQELNVNLHSNVQANTCL